MEFVPPAIQAGDASVAVADGGDSPSQGEVEAALERILGSRGFASAPRLQAMLKYMVAATLEKQTDRLKEFSIAVDVFGRPETFDPRLDSIVRTQASRLRKQMALYYERAPGETVRIEAPPGSYQTVFSRIAPLKLQAKIEQRADGSEGEPPVLRMERLPSPAGSGPAELEPKSEARPVFMAVALGVASLVLLALVAATWMSRPAARDLAVMAPTGPAIFVSRFQLVDGPGHGRQLRDGLQFELIDRLHQFPELSILGVDTVYGEEAEAATRNPQGADFILGGSVQSTETSLKVTSRLTRTADNTVVWSQVFDSPLSDASGILGVQSEIAGSVAAQLGQPYGVVQEKLKTDLSAARRMSLEDYLCVLDAYDYSRAKSAASHARVRACLEEVTARSPGYAPAWAKLSWMYGDEERFAFNRRDGEAPPFERAKIAAETAVRADPSAAMAHQYLAIALFHLGDDAGFRSEAERALQLNPNNSEILADVGLNLVLLDGSLRGREMAEKAVALNPGHPDWYHAGPAAWYLIHRDAKAALESALNFAPDGSPMSAYLLAAAYRLNGDGAKAQETLAELGRRMPGAVGDTQTLPKALRFPPQLVKLVFGN